MPLKFLYEDEQIFAVDKPSGLHSVALPGNRGGASIAEALLLHSPALSEASRKPEDAGLIQRLDFETSGVILGAKNREVWEKFFLQLQDEQIEKEYLVILEGELGMKRSVSGWIGSPARHAKKMRVYQQEPSREARALPAETNYQPLRYNSKNNATLCKALCPTARRHQIRAHAASIGHPLVGDSVYGSSSQLPAESKRTFFLHASLVRFTHPVTGKPVAVTAPATQSWF